MALWSVRLDPGGRLEFLGEPKAELVSLQQIRCVLATIRTGSFTGAADLLDVSQPAVAEQIRNLERTLGIDLFVRAGRGVRPTAAGTAFADRAPAIMGALDDALGSVREVRSLESGTLAFGLFATPEAYGIDHYASAFARKHPGISLRLVGRNSSIAADRVRVGELEAALVVLPIDDDGLDVRPVVRDVVVHVSSDSSQAGYPATVERLTRRPLILYDAESGDRDPLRRQLRERAQALGLQLTARVETETMVMALRLVADGVGDTYAPRTNMSAAVVPPGLTTVPFDPPVYETFALVARRGTRLSPAARVFADGLRAHMLTLGLEPI
jgi:DNA-binding transcriptional LysR family regulator